MSSSSRRRALAVCSVALSVGLCGALVASAGAASLKARFTYSFTAVQQTQWSYDNRVVVTEDCSRPPASGSGIQKAIFLDSGRAVLETGLDRNIKKGVLFGAGTTTNGNAQGVYDRQGSLVVANSQRGSCAQPDVAAATQGCGPGRKPFRLAMDLRAGAFQVTGTALQDPYAGGLLDSCPFLDYATFDQPQRLERSGNDSISNDFDNGLLGTTMKVTSARFFIGKAVVLRGSRTAPLVLSPADTSGREDATGLTAQTTVSWTLTFTPVKKRR